MDDKQIDAMCLAFIEGCDPDHFEYVSDERGGDLSAMIMDGTFDLRAGMRAAIELVWNDIYQEGHGDGYEAARIEADERL